VPSIAARKSSAEPMSLIAIVGRLALFAVVKLLRRDGFSSRNGR
jgi:hypothetical protein